MKQKLMLGLLAMILFASCKKDKDENEISLKGKWNLENTIIKAYQNGILVDTETKPGAGTTVDFQNNGNLAVTTPGSGTDNIPYTIQADSKVVLDGETFEIRNLTGTHVTLFIRRDFSANEYNEVTVNLKR